MNERVVEEITRNLLKNNGDYIPECEQITLPNGKRPEFVIYEKDFALVIECKKAKNKLKDAVKEVKEYAEELAKDYNVIAIAVAGGTNTSFRSYYYMKDGVDDDDRTFISLKAESIISFKDYREQVEQIEKEQELNETTLKKKADELNNLIRTYADVGIQKRSTLIAAILIAVENETFRATYKQHALGTLSKYVYRTISDILDAEENFPITKKTAILNEFYFLETDLNLNKQKVINGKNTTSIRFFTDYIVKKVYLKLKENSEIDLLAEFYTEFFRRTSLSGKELGIVLTPEHVKKFMARLININKTDVVLDTCTGTGGFLITSMNLMLNQAETEEERADIKANKLIGVELKANMFLMAYASMKFHGDGKSNLYLGDSLDPLTIAKYEDRANKCIINPPYSLGKKDKNQDEWNFVLTALNALKSHGMLAVIIPVSKFIGGNKANVQWKEDILEKHSLKAVISMPNEIFDAGTVTAIGIFQAHISHDLETEVILYNIEDDGFITDRKEGRKDNGKWQEIEDDACITIKNKKEIKGKSIAKILRAVDEWLYIAHAEVDYINLSKETFLLNIADYLIYKNNISEKELKLTFIGYGSTIKTEKIKLNNKEIVNTLNWENYKLTDLFNIQPGENVSAKDANDSVGEVRYISATSSNNGVSAYTSIEATHEGNCISVSSNGSVGEFFYHKDVCIINSDCKGLYLKNVLLTENKALFLCSVLKLWQPFFDYGRKLNIERLKKLSIKLPTKDGEPDWGYMENYIESLKQ